jgi:hypothetical protein
LYILVLELEHTFFSSSFSHSIVGFFVSSDIWSFLTANNLSRACVAKAQLHFLQRLGSDLSTFKNLLQLLLQHQEASKLFAMDLLQFV